LPRSKQTLDAMADEIFELYRVIAALRSQQNRGQEDLSETEFLTLDILAKDGPMTIGEAQRRIGVVPAQMSRVVRALEESGGKGYIECRINPEDRRRVDISLSKTGRDAHARFRTARLGSMYAVLEALPPDDRLEFMRMLRQIRTHVESAAGVTSEAE
jgi:DNA-binding MarR family transcriptional regulator